MAQQDEQPVMPVMNMIVAVDAANGIAKNDRMAWHLPKEFAHFIRQTTLTADPNKLNAVVMGRKSWDSLPENSKPLKDRINVVLSRSLEPVVSEDYVVANDFHTALRMLTEAPLFTGRVETVWNCGGADIYAQGLEHPWMHKLVLTRIEHDFTCDRFFPPVDWTRFELNDDFPHGQYVEEKSVRWTVSSYTKKKVASNGENKAENTSGA